MVEHSPQNLYRYWSPIEVSGGGQNFRPPPGAETPESQNQPKTHQTEARPPRTHPWALKGEMPWNGVPKTIHCGVVRYWKRTPALNERYKNRTNYGVQPKGMKWTCLPARIKFRPGSFQYSP